MAGVWLIILRRGSGNQIWPRAWEGGETKFAGRTPGILSYPARTNPAPPVWDFRASQSPDGRQIVFCRAETGGVPAIWIIDSDGRNARELTKGLYNSGADHPRWL